MIGKMVVWTFEEKKELVCVCGIFAFIQRVLHV